MPYISSLGIKPRYRQTIDGGWVHVCACGCGTPLERDTNLVVVGHAMRAASPEKLAEYKARNRSARRAVLEKQIDQYGQCNATTRRGHRCPRPVSEVGLCGVHRWFLKTRPRIEGRS